MNLFIRELKAHKKALLIWCVSIALLITSGMAKYSGYAAGGTNIFLQSIPYSLRALLGFGNFDATTFSGFYAILFSYIELTAALHATLLGASILSKEERDKTAEFLMSKPVSRKKILTAKLAAGLTNVFVVNIVSFAASVAVAEAKSAGSQIIAQMAVFCISMLCVQLIFYAIGSISAVCLKKPRSSGSFATGILFAAFALAKITDIFNKINILNMLSPFKYFDIVRLEAGSGIDGISLLFSLALSGIFFVFTYIFYEKRDLCL